MEAQKKITAKGGTMRLGAYPLCDYRRTLASRIYGVTDISERHRHRWEFNNAYLGQYEAEGMLQWQKSREQFGRNCRIVNHPFFIGVQYHPELRVP